MPEIWNHWTFSRLALDAPGAPTYQIDTWKLFLNPTIIKGLNLLPMVGYMRPLLLVSILMLILNIPLQTLSFLTTWGHVQSHHKPELVHAASTEADHDHDHGHEHDDEPKSQGSKRSHCHEKDFWGLFSNPALGSRPVLTASLTFVVQPLPQFEEHELVCKVFCQGLFRPPIA